MSTVFRFDKEILKERSPRAFAEQRPVRFQDVDAAGIVFYPRVLEYFHDLHVSFMAHAGCPLHEVLKERVWLAPIRHAEADYLKPLRFGNVIEVALVQAHIESTEVTLGFRVAEVQSSLVCAVGQTVHTFVDASLFHRRAVPASMAQALASIGSGHEPARETAGEG